MNFSCCERLEQHCLLFFCNLPWTLKPFFAETENNPKFFNLFWLLSCFMLSNHYWTISRFPPSTRIIRIEVGCCVMCTDCSCVSWPHYTYLQYQSAFYVVLVPLLLYTFILFGVAIILIRTTKPQLPIHASLDSSYMTSLLFTAEAFQFERHDVPICFNCVCDTGTAVLLTPSLPSFCLLRPHKQPAL